MNTQVTIRAQSPAAVTAAVRVSLPSFKLIASCDGDADGPVLDMLIAHGLPADEDMLALLDEGERTDVENSDLVIERSRSGWMLLRPDGEHVVDGEITLYANHGRPTAARQHPYDTCGTDLDVCFDDAIISGLAQAYGPRSSDAFRAAVREIEHDVDHAARFG